MFQSTKEVVIIAQMQHEFFSSNTAPSSFQIISAGADGEYGSRMFVGNITVHSEASNIVPEPWEGGGQLGSLAD